MSAEQIRANAATPTLSAGCRVNPSDVPVCVGRLLRDGCRPRRTVQVMRLTEQNPEFLTELRSLGVVDGTTVWSGINRALGVGPGQTITVEDFPVYGYFAASSPTQAAPEVPLVMFILTPGRFIRYEWTPSAAMTATFPLDRLCGVEELESGETYTVALHLDWHTEATRWVAETTTLDNGTRGTRGEGRTEGLTYRITVTADRALVLAEFSRRARLLIGL